MKSCSKSLAFPNSKKDVQMKNESAWKRVCLSEILNIIKFKYWYYEDKTNPKGILAASGLMQKKLCCYYLKHTTWFF